MPACGKPALQIANQIKSAWLKDLTGLTDSAGRTGPSAQVELDVTGDGADDTARFVEAVAHGENAPEFRAAIEYIIAQLKSDLNKAQSKRAVIVATTYYLKSRSAQNRAPTKVPRTGLFIVREGLNKTGKGPTVLRVPSYREGTGLYQYRGASDVVCPDHATAGHVCAIMCPRVNGARKDVCDCHKHLYCRDHKHGDDLRLARELDSLLERKKLRIVGTELRNTDGKKTTSKVFTAFVGSMQTEGSTAGPDAAAELKQRLDAFEEVYKDRIFAKARCAECMSNRGCRRSRSKRKIERTQTPKLRSELGRPYISMRPGVFYDAERNDLSEKLRSKLAPQPVRKRRAEQRAESLESERADRTERTKRAKAPERARIESEKIESPRTPVRRSARIRGHDTPSAPGLAQPPKGHLLPLTAVGFGFV